MAAYTLYDASIVVAKDALTALETIIAKAESSPAAASIPTARIYDDMLPFSFQVHFATATIGKMTARLTGQEPSAYSGFEADKFGYGDMKARIAEVRALVDAADKATVNGRESEIVALGMGPGKPEAKLPGYAYVHGYALPNIFFHTTTAYDIIRKEGVQIGKMDFLGPFIGKFVQG